MDIGSIQNPHGSVSAEQKKAERAPVSTTVRKLAEADAAGLTVADPSTAQASPQADATGAVTREQVEAAVATIQDFVQSVRRSINFSLEEGGGRVIVKVTDAGSGDVIRQIPSEEALQLAENLSEIRSLLFKAEA